MIQSVTLNCHDHFEHGSIKRRLGCCFSEWSGFIQTVVRMEGTMGCEAAMTTVKANNFELAYMTSFARNVCTIQASEQLHSWAKCVPKSMETNSWKQAPSAPLGEDREPTVHPVRHDTPTRPRWHVQHC